MKWMNCDLLVHSAGGGYVFFSYFWPGRDPGRKGDYERDKKLGRYGYYDLICYGADGVESEDDIVSWDMPGEK